MVLGDGSLEDAPLAQHPRGAADSPGDGPQVGEAAVADGGVGFRGDLVVGGFGSGGVNGEWDSMRSDAPDCLLEAFGVDDAETDVACGGVEDGGVSADGGRWHLGDLDAGDVNGRDLPGMGFAPPEPDPWLPTDPIGEDRQQAADGTLPPGWRREGSAVEGADVGERPADDVGLVGVAGVEVGQADPYRPGSPCAGGASAA